MKRCVPVLLMCALAVASPTFAQSDNAGTTTGKTTDKEKAKEEKAKDKSDPASGASAPTAAKPAADAAAAAAPQDEKDDAVLDPAQPDFTVITLPTTLRMPKYKSAFRVTHRFARPLGEGDFGDLSSDFFGLDASAQIGLEFRFGIMPGTQIGINRTSDKTIQFFGEYDVHSQTKTFPVGIAAYVSIDGTNNFKDSYSPAVGAVVSREVNKHAALYVVPMWVNNTNPLPSELADSNNTFTLGIGGRVRVHGTTYVVAEIIPRVAGYDPGVNQAAFGIEKRVGGHSFQLNFSNSLATTMAPVARGGFRNKDWYLGFNITRKFF